MIQRLQSIFLAIVTMSMITMLEGNIWMKLSPLDGQELCAMSVWYLEKVQETTSYYPYIFVGLLAILIALTSLYTIFSHDNRKLQMWLALLNALMLMVLIGVVVYLIVTNAIMILPNAVEKYQFKCILPAIALINTLLAYHFIRKDDRLVGGSSLR